MVQLRPIAEYDFQKIVNWNTEKGEHFLYQWAGQKTFQYPLSVDQIKHICIQAHSQTNIICSNGDAVGTIALDQIDKKSRCAHLCRFLLSDQARGHGLSRLVLQELVRLAFCELGIERLTLRVFCFNVAAIRCYERCGFVVKEYHTAADPKWNAYTMELQKR